MKTDAAAAAASALSLDLTVRGLGDLADESELLHPLVGQQASHPSPA
ncbi:hypothetical protein [Streptomyces sp. NPDC093589]